MDDSAQKNKCPCCGATDIVFDAAKGKFHCLYCGSDSEPDAQGVLKVITTLNNAKTLVGHHLSPGMGDLNIPDEGVLSFRCPSCGAEMSVETRSDIGSLVCHWCRHVISVADKINNGVRPDCLIPFTISKPEAETLIRNHLNEHSFYANRAFAKTFRAEMIKPVYLPYAMGDFHFKSTHSGKAAIYVNCFGKKFYTLDLYKFGRRFNLYINDLLIEANHNYLRARGEKATVNSKNIVNSILPFDTSKIVDYDPKFLNGDYRAEFRDLTFDDIKMNIRDQFEDISCYHAIQTMKEYNSGHIFENNQLEFVGDRIDSVLCPLWLYSYQSKNGKLHYICVNGQTGELAASIPLNNGRVYLFASIVPLILIATIASCQAFYEQGGQELLAIGVSLFLILFTCFLLFIARRHKQLLGGDYTGKYKHHEHESATQSLIDGLEKDDAYLERVPSAYADNIGWHTFSNEK
jgi:transcription elongation factor Elf1